MTRLPTLLALLGACLVATPVAAQSGCEFGDRGRNDVVYQTIPNVGSVTYIGGPHFVCEGGTVQIWADSAVVYENRGMSHLIRRVRYLEAGRELLANEARYFSNEGRLQANGRVSVRDEAQGSSIRNGDLIYLLETDFRPVAEMTVTTGADGLRPRAVLTPPRDSTAAATDSLGLPLPPPAPYTVDGDRIFLRGAGYFTASGTVEIMRDSLRAYADSAEYTETDGRLALEGSGRVVGDAYELTGRRIVMTSPGGAESDVHALREARLIGDGVLLTAAQIRVFLLDDALERLVATPIQRTRSAQTDSVDLERPVANVEDFVLQADSIELRAPGERVERVFAAGRARSVSTSRDSLNVERLPEVARTDWLEGDTVIVTFAAEPTGTDGRSEVEEIVARVGARSLYRLPPNDSTARPGVDPPAVHFVTGQEIRIVMNAGEVQGMHVVGQTRGIHLEPLRRPPPDSAQADSTRRARVDTFSVGVSEPSPDSTPSNEPRPRGEELPRLEEVPWIRP